MIFKVERYINTEQWDSLEPGLFLDTFAYAELGELPEKILAFLTHKNWPADLACFVSTRDIAETIFPTSGPVS